MKTVRNLLPSHTLATWFACAYLFFSHVPRTTAMVNIIVGLMLVTTLVLTLKGKLQIDWRSSLVRAYTAFVSVVVLGIAFSPYWQESLIPLRRELLPMTLVFLLLTSQVTVKQSGQEASVALMAIWSIIAAFVTRTALAFVDWIGQGVHTDFYTSNRSVAKFFDFYAIDASLLLPVIVAAIFTLSMKRATRGLLVASLIAGLLLILVSSVRTALVVSAVVLLVQLLPRLKSPRVWAGLAVGIVSLAIVVASTKRFDSVVDRYATVFAGSSYQGSEKGVSSVYERLAIWKGTLEIAAERPMLGYGLGWQKLYDAAYEGGYVARWRESDAMIDRTAANYFDQYEKGMVNPHNLWVDITFETGLLGLMSYILLLLLVFVRALKYCKCAQTSLQIWFREAALSYLLAYGLINMMGGFWLTSGATLMLLVVSELLAQDRVSNDPKGTAHA